MTRLVLLNIHHHSLLLLFATVFFFAVVVVIDTTVTSFQFRSSLPRHRQRLQHPSILFYDTKETRTCDSDATSSSNSGDRVSIITATEPRAHKDFEGLQIVSRSQFLVSSLIGGSSLLLVDFAGDRWSTRSSIANAIDIDSLSKDAKKLQKDVAKESKKIQKTVNQEVKKAQKETKKVTKKIEKEVKKDIKVVKKEVKKVDKVVQKETKKVMKQVDQSTQQIKSKIESTTKTNNSMTKSTVGGAAAGSTRASAPTTTTTGIDVSKIKKVCNDPLGKCL